MVGNQDYKRIKDGADFAAISAVGENSVGKYPQGDSNPCLSRERAMS
jgi:hypothetical protein